MLDFFAESDGVFGNIDPDINTCLINNLQNNNYYSLQELKSLIQESGGVDCNLNSTFSLLHLNMQNQNSKHDSFVNFLSSTGLEDYFGVIAVTESWLTQDQCGEFRLDNYQYVGGQGRMYRKGGGVGFYINNKYTFILLNDLNLNVDDSVAESLFVQINLPGDRKKTLAVIYRPPSGSIQLFFDSLNQLLNKIQNSSKDIIFCGDFNLDNLLYNTNVSITSFMDCMFGAGFGIAISYPTRITETTATLLDQIFYNNFKHEVISGNICVTISDHMPVFFIQKNNVNLQMKDKLYSKRVFTETNISRFTTALQLMNWNFIKTQENVNLIYDTFMDKFSALYNIYFPIKMFRCCQNRTVKNPWFTLELKDLCTKKNELYYNWLRYPSAENKLLYRRHSNLEKSRIRAVKKDYFIQKLNQNINNSKNTWKILNTIIGNKPKKQSFPKFFK